MELYLTSTIRINENSPVVSKNQVISTSLEGKAQCQHDNMQTGWTGLVQLNFWTGAGSQLNTLKGAQKEVATWLSPLDRIKPPWNTVFGACLDLGAEQAFPEAVARWQGKPTAMVQQWNQWGWLEGREVWRIFSASIQTVFITCIWWARGRWLTMALMCSIDPSWQTSVEPTRTLCILACNQLLNTTSTYLKNLKRRGWLWEWAPGDAPVRSFFTMQHPSPICKELALPWPQLRNVFDSALIKACPSARLVRAQMQMKQFTHFSLFGEHWNASGWRDAQRFGFKPSVRTFVVEGCLMSAF